MPTVTSHPDAPVLTRRLWWLVVLLLFASGFAGLVYQVLWMRQLGLLFGNTSAAASVTLAAFFAGLAAGGWYWGRRVTRSPDALRLYAWLELGIAGTALVYYATLAVFYAVYPMVYEAASANLLGWGIKFALALLLIFPPAFCMGGTVPAVGHLLIRERSVFGKTAAWLYGVNTFGAALGVVVAAFVLVPTLGFNLSYAVAVVVSAGVGVAAWLLAKKLPSTDASFKSAGALASELTGDVESTSTTQPRPIDRWLIAVLCFVSGFGVLALEVLWTRMLAQVHGNSVYAFAVMLTVVLVGLGLGAWVSGYLARRSKSPVQTLAVLLTLGGAAVAIGPTIFMSATHQMEPLSSLEPWLQYIARLFGIGFSSVGGVVLMLGVVFPFIMKLEERHASAAGQSLGRLLALNTAGSITGALLCGFVLLPWLGMWGTMRWIAVAYLVCGLLVPRGFKLDAHATRLAAAALIALSFTALDPTGLPATGRVPGKGYLQVLETYEATDCTVSVVKTTRGSITIKINSGYELGSTGAYREQVDQTRVPLHAFPDTRSIFYLGMGTGISAGEAALEPEFDQVERVVVCELVPEVVQAAKKYIPEAMLGGLFTDPRATVLVEDGRQYLRVTDETYDMINADLFLPYRRGAGSLYSRDHFRAARQRLNPGGVYVQWLPLFQLTESEFGIIARTMLESFDRVTLWRNNFEPGHEIVALVGQVDPKPIAIADNPDPAAMRSVADRLDWNTARPSMALPARENITFFYGGNLTESAALFQEYGINTDDRPLIEYQTPRTFRANAGQRVIWFVGPKITSLTGQLLDACPPETDPVLADRAPANRNLADAGLAFHRSMVDRAMGRADESYAHWQQFLRAWRAAAE